jgi:nucleoid DNA-binding protein
VATYLAQQKGITKKVAAGFLQQLTTILSEGLLRDGEAKVKGLGTFKIEWHESRMSVNVQTGEKYEIAGHNKVTFTPDKVMREVVNKPFEHLEPVVMDDESTSEIDAWMDDEELRLKRFSDQAQEILGIIADLQQIQPKDINQVSPLSKTAIDSPIDQVEQMQQDVPIAKQEIKHVSEPLIPIVADSINPISDEKTVEKEALSSFAEEKAFMERMITQAPAKNKKWIGLSILFAVIVVISIPIYYYFFMMNHGNKVAPPTTVLTSTSPTQNKQIGTTPLSQAIQSKPAVAKPVTPQTTNADPFKQPRTYKETLATETFHEGSRLTLMSLKYYGNKLFWVYIYEANKNKIPNPDVISAGTRIVIPKLNPKLIDLHNPQCLIQASALQTAYKNQHATQSK